MSLIARISASFPHPIQERGQTYFARNAVEITQAGPSAVRAVVAGTSEYWVSLWLSGDSLGVQCTCPFFQDSKGPCKHVWATILAAEDAGHLGGPADADGLGPEVGDADTDPRFGWRLELARLGRAVRASSTAPDGWPKERELVYVVDGPASIAQGSLVLELQQRRKRKNGGWTRLKPVRVAFRQLTRLPEPADRRIFALLLGAREDGNPAAHGIYDQAPSRYRVPESLQEVLLPLLCETGRCRLRRSHNDARSEPVRWLGGEPWQLFLAVDTDAAARHYGLHGVLRRGIERRSIAESVLLAAGGVVFFEDGVGRLDGTATAAWVRELGARGRIDVPVDQANELLEQLLSLPRLPQLDLPSQLEVTEVHQPPRACLKLDSPAGGWGGRRLRGELAFSYEGESVVEGDWRRGLFRAESRRLLVRDHEFERAAAARLEELGFKRSSSLGFGDPAGYELVPSQLWRVARTLLSEGWRIESDGRHFRQPGDMQIEVSSGIDWFDLKGSVDFGGTRAPLAEVFAALRRGESTVTLEDGGLGMLPEEWMREYALFASLGTAQGQRLRFRRSQLGFIDALLAAQPVVTADAAFRKARERLRRLDGIQPLDAAPGFVGRLRGYQREGLGWLRFLQELELGGCLADDMGLGKTVQVLALLESRRKQPRARKGARPSLVVVPRSLVFNWKQEAARFTPQLRILEHTGVDRARSAKPFNGYDVVLTTYGTLRRDILLLKDVVFDYAVLDEAQTIKNPRTASAKATRLLKARHRLVLSGTPIENHLGELWSLFEFLNPGMLGRAALLRAGGPAGDPEARALLAKALRPFMLRRTKEQVAKELPAKLEQTIYCELEPKQRELYDTLREHYRASLLTQVEERGIKRSKLQVLEALLRLRQVACHPGLVDRERADQPAAKLEMLLPRLAEVLDEGHKALVFSQFTSLLSLLRRRLDEQGVSYEYLDGRTRDRASRVRRFQEAPGPGAFLISLKAGGLGLNLTAAEYVFLLDPWWNPAVEAQAIDRTHRIGQRRRVFAYRLIARDTVEEKVLELQQTKRGLAEAIITADNNLIRDLEPEDLQLLLS